MLVLGHGWVQQNFCSTAEGIVLGHEHFRSLSGIVIPIPITLPRYPARLSEPRIIPAGEMPSVKECGHPNNIYYLHGVQCQL